MNGVSVSRGQTDKGWVPSPVLLGGAGVGLLKDSACEMSHFSSIPWANTDIPAIKKRQEALCGKDEGKKESRSWARASCLLRMQH